MRTSTLLLRLALMVVISMAMSCDEESSRPRRLWSARSDGAAAAAVVRATLGRDPAPKPGLHLEAALYAVGDVRRSAAELAVDRLKAEVAPGSRRDALGEYESKTRTSLDASIRAERRAIDGERPRFSTLPSAELDTMTTRALDSMARVAEQQYLETMLAWMRWSAERSRTPPIAQGADGFIDLIITCRRRAVATAAAMGGAGCEVTRVTVGSEPVVVEALKSMPVSLMMLPVHRRIFIAPGGSAGWAWATPVFELDPERHRAVLPERPDLDEVRDLDVHDLEAVLSRTTLAQVAL